MASRILIIGLPLTANVGGTFRDVSIDVCKRQTLRPTGNWRTTREVRVPRGSAHNLGPAACVVRADSPFDSKHLGDFDDNDTGAAQLKLAQALA